MSIQEVETTLTGDFVAPRAYDAISFTLRSPEAIHQPAPLHAIAKRAFDIAGSALLITLLLPVMSLVALAVLVDDPGSVFFRQERVGRGRKPFRIVKFRTMVKDAEARLHADAALYQQYLDNGHKLPPGEDPRLTRIGGFIRATSLDELPQLFNVLAGSMSLVGPRPVLESELRDHYGAAAHPVLTVRPGMTGLWQVSGRNEIGYDERVQIDLDYAGSWTFYGDLAIMVRTVGPVLKRTGAS